MESTGSLQHHHLRHHSHCWSHSRPGKSGGPCYRWHLRMLLLAPGTFTLFGGIPPDWGAPAFPRSLAAVLAVHCLTDRPTWRRVLLSLCLIVFAPRLDRACLDWWRVSRGGLALVLFVCAACSQVLGLVASFNNKKEKETAPATTSNSDHSLQNRQRQPASTASTTTTNLDRTDNISSHPRQRQQRPQPQQPLND